MSGVDSYSTTPATNATCTGGSVNWIEGQPPSSVNNSERQCLADLRSAFNDLAWFQYGSGDQNTATHLALPGVYASATSWTYAGVDVTTAFHTGRRVRAVGVSTGTIYGRISSSSFSTNTTVNAVWDSGSLSNETLTISLSQTPVTGSPVALPIGTISYTDGSGAGLTLTTVRGAYVRLGSWTLCDMMITYPSTSNGLSAVVGGLPFSFANVTGVGGMFPIYYGGPNFIMGLPIPGTNSFQVVTPAAVAIINSNLTLGTLRAQFMIPTI